MPSTARSTSAPESLAIRADPSASSTGTDDRYADSASARPLPRRLAGNGSGETQLNVV